MSECVGLVEGILLLDLRRVMRQGEKVYSTYGAGIYSGISCFLDNVGCEGGCKNVLDGIGG